ncbi:hypothetical protein Q5P01_018611 [Channa striata]|uniref:DM domain-containing protein n=1 Tax=Channa striata TaxID=64152 RepID=A0AA88M4S8_CHASR|nr:hypothetical protein Q5P01_018611 [Channa striata]
MMRYQRIPNPSCSQSTVTYRGRGHGGHGDSLKEPITKKKKFVISTAACDWAFPPLTMTPQPSSHGSEMIHCVNGKRQVAAAELTVPLNHRTLSMSLSKQVLPAAADDEQPRVPKCSRCRHHGIIVRQKGHTKLCPFLRCHCWKCLLIAERTRITALERSMMKVQHRARSTGPDRGRRAAAEGACSASTAAGDDGPSAPSQQSAGSPEEAAADDGSTRGRRDGPGGGGKRVAGWDSGDVLPFSSGGEKMTPGRAPSLGEFGQPATLPFIHFPFRMGAHGPRSYVPCPNFMINMPWLPPAPTGLYNPGPCRPVLFPFFQPGAPHYSPRPEPRPPADREQVFFTLQPPPLPEAFQQEPYMQPPEADHAGPDIVELD